MRVDAETLAAFYASPLGELARRQALRRVMAAWPDAAGADMLGVGYPGPYLDGFAGSARRLAIAMPAQQGARRWPPGGKCTVTLADEQRLPFIDAIFDRALIVHALEETENPRAFLREIWRVMAPEGRLIVIVANRMGLWAQSEQTPFGHGRPYTRGQLATLLDDGMFTRIASARALYAPPRAWTPLLKAGNLIERVGETLWPAFGGLVLMEARKRLVAEAPRAGQRAPAGEAQKAPRPALRARDE